MISGEIISNKIKVNLVGNTMVGKTSILHRMRYGVFNPDTIATVGGSFVALTKDNINYEIWDTAGQERYLALIPMYFRGVKISLFVFDVNDVKSLKYINKYKNILADDDNIKIIVLANKTDLFEELIQQKNMTKEEKENIIKELTKQVYDNFEKISLIDRLHGLHFISAKNGSGFNDFLEHLHECGKILPVNKSINKNILNELNVKSEYVDHENIDNTGRCC